MKLNWIEKMFLNKNKGKLQNYNYPDVHLRIVTIYSLYSLTFSVKSF